MSVVKAVLEEILNYNGNIKEYDLRTDQWCFKTPNREEVYCYGSNGSVKISYTRDRCRTFGNYNIKMKYVK